jgi:hypothetical protein
MASRLELHEKLVSVLGARYVYFQPPESVKMKYPAIVYERSDIPNKFANDDVYLQTIKYKVTVVDRDPDSEVVERMSKFKTARFEKHYVVDGLNHDTFTIYY